MVQTWSLLSYNSPNTENQAAKRSHAPGKSWAKRQCHMVFASTSLMVWPYADGNSAVQVADVNSSSGVLLDTAWARYSHSHCRQVCPCRHTSSTKVRLGSGKELKDSKWANIPEKKSNVQIKSNQVLTQLLVKQLLFADSHLSMVERVPFLNLEGLGSTRDQTQGTAQAVGNDLEIWVSFQMNNPGGFCCKPHSFLYGRTV